MEDLRSTTVGVNALFIQPRRNQGTDTYIREILRELEQRSDLRVVLFTTRQNHDSFAAYRNLRRVLCPVAGNRRASRILFEQTRLARLAQQEGCGVLFCPGYLAPVRSSVPVVVTIHDTQFRDVPESMSWSQRWIYGLVVPRASRRAAAVIAVSEFGRDRILHHLRIDPRRVRVIHEAPRRPPPGRAPGAAEVQRVLDRQGIRLPYLLSVSSGLPHKNVDGLVAGVLASGVLGQGIEQLVLAGNNGPTHRDITAAAADPEPAGRRPPSPISGLRSPMVRSLGFVEDSDLEALYAGAQGFVLASTYEGFGLTVLEAMAHRVPVACSRVGSLPEIAGDAALLFDPASTPSIAEAVRSLIDPARRGDLQRRGTSNVARFSWERAAKETADVLREAAAPADRGIVDRRLRRTDFA